MIYINKYLIKPSPTFEKELKKIYNHIFFRFKEPNTENIFYKKVISEIYSLQHFPERYIKISNYKKKCRNLRRLPIDKYVVIYEVDNDTRSSLYLTHLSW